MKLSRDIPLASLTTMRLGGEAKYVIEASNREDIVQAVEFAKSKNLPWFVMGSGSNVIARGDYDGVVILNRILEFKKISEDESSSVYEIGAGEVWDSVVERLTILKLSGVEAMSFIPGYAGATPIQNVGAYGQEIADTLIELEAYDTDSGEFVTLSNSDCQFSYRNSKFKDPSKRHHIVISLTLKLSKSRLQPPFYPSLQKYMDENFITDYSPTSVRNAVIAVRSSKLPPVDKIASAGSFFKNPIVEVDLLNKILLDFPDAPHWQMPNNKVKLAAGWLIDKAGLRNFSRYGMEVFPGNALVLTNISAKSIGDLEKFKFDIIETVRQKFGVVLEQEPENL